MNAIPYYHFRYVKVPRTGVSVYWLRRLKVEWLQGVWDFDGDCAVMDEPARLRELVRDVCRDIRLERRKVRRLIVKKEF